MRKEWIILTEKLKKLAPYARNIYSALFASLVAWLHSNLMRAAYLYAYDYNDLMMLGETANGLFALLFPVVVVFWTALVYNYFDNLDLFNKKAYFKGDNKAPLIYRPQYLSGFVISLLFSTLILTHGYDMALSFFFPMLNIVVARLLSVITMAAVRLIQLRSLQGKWNAEIENPVFVERALFKRNRDMDNFKPHQMILQPIGYSIVFAILAYYVGYFFIPLAMVVFNIIISPTIWPILIIALVVIFTVTLIFRLSYNLKRRKKLLRKLRQLEHEKLAKVEMNGSKYLSCSFTRMSFTLKVTDVNGQIYNCVVVTCGKINAPMYFKSDEYMVEHGFHLRGGALLARGGAFIQAVDVSKMGGKGNPTNLVAGYRIAHKLDFPDIDGKRVVIINPTPTAVYAVEGTEFRAIDTGEDMKDYTLYTATGFFNHIERQSRKKEYFY